MANQEFPIDDADSPFFPPLAGQEPQGGRQTQYPPAAGRWRTQHNRGSRARDSFRARWARAGESDAGSSAAYGAADQRTNQPTEQPVERPIERPTLWLSALTLAAVVATISVGLLVFHATLSNLMWIAIAETVVAVAYQRHITGHTWVMLPFRVVGAAVRSIWKARQALAIFLLIGALIGTFIAAGTVGTLIHWGVRLISPAWFLPAGLIFTSLMSLATGTAWGTVGTAGVVLIGIGDAMGLPLGLVGGMIVSGAAFGDKMSPVSDTTNLAAMSAGTNIYRHIRSMMYTTVPTYLLVLVLYALAGLRFSPHDVPRAQLTALTRGLEHVHPSLSWVTLLPLLVLVVLSLAKVRAWVTMLAATVVAMWVAFLAQHMSFGAVFAAAWHGGERTSGVAALDGLLARGGVTSMWPTLQLSLLALSLGGLLYRFGFVDVLLTWILRGVRRTGSLVAATIGSAFVANVGMGEAYMSIILGGQLFQGAYDRAGVDRAVLSRSLEEGATLTTPLIPWTTAGIFFATTMQIPTVEYLPYAWLNLLNPLMGVLFGYLGWGLLRQRSHASATAPNATNEGK